MEFLLRFIATIRQKQPSAAESLIAEQFRVLSDLCRRQQETLDRIVAAKFDKPFLPAQPANAANPTMPDYMLQDQPMSAESDLAGALTVESDADFLEAVGV